MIKRTLAPILRQVAREYPVVTVTGPRQSGKTTLVRTVLRQHEYVSLEEPDLRDFALEDPKGFLAQFDGPVILDEVQRTPDIFSYIQGIVDRDDSPGRFVLSGSQNFLLLESISQSLAGRSAVLHLLPFSRSELLGRKPLDLSRLGKEVPRRRGGSDADLGTTLFTGFYPRIHDKGLSPGRWLADYYRTYVERDVRDIVNVGDLETFGRFVRLCAGRNGQLLNLSSLATDAGVTHTTARRWLSILEASFLLTTLRPHYRNFRKRLVKTPKLYFLDTGLLCYLLRIRSEQDLLIHASRGSVFESFVVSELMKNFMNAGNEPDIWFWCDSTGHEIDVILEYGQAFVPIEIKSGQTVTRDFFSGLDYWRDLASDRNGPAALIYGGDRSFSRNDVAVCSWMVL